MSNIFYKPYIDGKEVFFPYSREDMCKRPIFPTEVLDGGAFFFANDALGATDGDTILEKIMSGEIFSYWMRNGKLDWTCAEKEFFAADYTHEWEGNIWINRLYILLPLAQKYCITHEARYARKWFDILSDWMQNNPYPAPDDEKHHIVWRDMQVTWRSISIVHSIFLLGKCEEFSQKEWDFIYDAVKMHAKHMFGEGVRYATFDKPDNHRLQIATSLIMFGTLFPEFFDTARFIEIAKKIIKLNMETSIFPDGCNNEDSMSYSHFIARLYLEAELYMKYNGYGNIDECAKTVRDQYEFLYNFASPDGKTLQIGDSYSMDAFADIEFVNSIYPLDFPRERTSRLFAGSRMAVLRNKRFDLYVDAMDMTEWHQHFGRPTFVLYCDRQQMVVDSGSINYDRGGLRHELNSEKCHNVIACDEIPLTREPSNEKLVTEEFFADDEKQVLTVCNTVTSDGGASYKWTRRFELYEDRLEILDSVNASEQLHFTSRLHLPDCRTGYYSPLKDLNCLKLRFASKMESVTTDTPFEISYMPRVDENNRMSYSTVVARSFFASEFSEKTVIRFDEIPSVEYRRM